MEMHDAWFFIGVFVFIFLIWAATGGPLHPIAFTGPRLAAPQELGGGTYLQLPRAPFGIGGTGNNVSLPGSSSGGGSVGGSGSSDGSSTFSNGVFGTPSPYRNAVRMNHYVSSAGSDPKNEYLELSIAQGSGIPIDLSEWTLVSDVSGNAKNIPRGTEVPSSGTINAAQDIVLQPGVRALIISGRSPIGASFRENKCIGYFSSFQQFSPQLPQNCPAPSTELSSFYSGSIRDTGCIDYVNRLSRCQVVLTPPTTVSGSCQSFLVKYLNYNGCVSAHQNDADFLGDTWRIYLGRTNAMWRTQHELVKLLDVNGKTVDAFSY
ncbi:MAG: hypothetical protein NUV60_00315 [Patescibacteria group bacterium]|nr:hypothetical protein [Patescibacteria group bacterium]